MSLRPPQTSQGFKHLEGPYGTLIVPSQNKWRWSEEERHFRSLLLGEGGQVLSSGFEKFANWDEPNFVHDRESLIKALQSGESVYVLEKIDGSLTIRSVIDGKVIIRTRGTQDGGIRKEVLFEIAGKLYPKLLDPLWMPDSSLLFEFVSQKPQWQNVLSYHQDDLILLGGVEHKSLTLWSWPETASFGRENNLHLAPVHPLPASLKELVKMVRGWEGSEGVVARWKDGKERMLKIKADSYLQLARMRHNLDAKQTIKLCRDHSIASMEEFQALLEQKGVEIELMLDLAPLVQAWVTAQTCLPGRLAQLDEIVLQAQMQFTNKPTKIHQAIRQHSSPDEQEVIQLLMDGQENAANTRLERVLLERELVHLKADQLQVELAQTAS
jgi:hypothetical protein